VVVLGGLELDPEVPEGGGVVVALGVLGVLGGGVTVTVVVVGGGVVDRWVGIPDG
jgi:hypothetical protein